MQQVGFQSMSSFLTLMLDPFAPTRAGGTFGPAIGYAPEPSQPPEIAQAYAAVTPAKAAPFEQRWSMWAAGYGGQARIQGDANVLGSHDTTARAFGVAGGADYKVSPNTTLGFALAGGATNWGLASNLGTGKSDAFQVGGYASSRAGAAYLSAAAAYALHWASTERMVTLVGLDRLEASFNAQSFGGRIEGGYRFGGPGFGLTPYAAGQVLGVRTPAYTERATAGTNAFALNYEAKTATTSRSELGLWADSTAMLDAGTSLLLRARAAWAHNFNTDRTINAVFQTLPGANFTVGGAVPAVDTTLVSAAAELRMANGWTLGAKFDGEVGPGTQSYAGTGTLRYAW
jgi:outer membrane autotransporter protein